MDLVSACAKCMLGACQVPGFRVRERFACGSYRGPLNPESRPRAPDSGFRVPPAAGNSFAPSGRWRSASRGRVLRYRAGAALFKFLHALPGRRRSDSRGRFRAEALAPLGSPWLPLGVPFRAGFAEKGVPTALVRSSAVRALAAAPNDKQTKQHRPGNRPPYSIFALSAGQGMHSAGS